MSLFTYSLKRAEIASSGKDAVRDKIGTVLLLYYSIYSLGAKDLTSLPYDSSSMFAWLHSPHQSSGRAVHS
jgi:hypothetical protein